MLAGLVRRSCWGRRVALAALATLLDAVGLVEIDWRRILAAVVVGTAASFGLERVRGKYVDARPPDDRSAS